MRPQNLNRAARDYLDSESKFASGVAMAPLHWLTQSYGSDPIHSINVFYQNADLYDVLNSPSTTLDLIQ